PLGGAARRYSSGFGMREHPVHGGRKMHWGQDMAAPAGTPVNSMQAGRISRIDRSGDVTVTHADGSTKTYRHIDPGGIREGQTVEAGGPLGRLRAHDPRSTGPHLHLEATDAQGRRYDPRPEIEAAQRQRGEAAGPRRSPADAARPAEDAGLRQLRPWTAKPWDKIPAEAAEPRPGLRNQDTEVERPQLERASMRGQDRPVPRPADLAPPRRLRERDDPQAPSPRFAEPRQLEARRRPETDGPGPRAGGIQVASAGPVTQNFHGGFDAGEVARRSTLERNRAIRRSQAGALHGIGRIA
ncbi:peptidoglycan DD-metalloendopeptidase family protein, partial [Methylobacterium aquaticum]|uniref:M23 family metallopeptidase n=1 Tax=Methylobacterium aquaticum TaxID=270351 RepID=UPI003D16B55F